MNIGIYIYVFVWREGEEAILKKKFTTLQGMPGYTYNNYFKLGATCKLRFADFPRWPTKSGLS